MIVHVHVHERLEAHIADTDSEGVRGGPKEGPTSLSRPPGRVTPTPGECRVVRRPVWCAAQTARRREYETARWEDSRTAGRIEYVSSASTLARRHHLPRHRVHRLAAGVLCDAHRLPVEVRQP